MRSDLIYTSKIDMPREKWLEFRHNGIGGSEVGTILGLNPYQSSLELFYKKIDLISDDVPENDAMFWGNVLEEVIADKWQYWETDSKQMIENHNKGEIKRRCRRVNSIVQNPDYPWLFSNLDRVINKTAGRGEGVLEIKTISGYVVDQWQSRIPPYQITQLMIYMVICDFEYGELAILKDGRFMDVIPFVKNQSLCEGIISRTKDFWDKVLEGRKISSELRKKPNNSTLLSSLHSIEPEPDGSEAYALFLNKKYKGEGGTRSGTLEEQDWAEKLKQNDEDIKLLETTSMKFENMLKSSMGEVEEITFGKNGKVTWKVNKNGSRVFRNSIKP